MPAVDFYAKHGRGKSLAHYALYSNDILLFCHEILRLRAWNRFVLLGEPESLRTGCQHSAAGAVTPKSDGTG